MPIKWAHYERIRKFKTFVHLYREQLPASRQKFALSLRKATQKVYKFPDSRNEGNSRFPRCYIQLVLDTSIATLNSLVEAGLV